MTAVTTLTIDATITERGQTTVPAAIRLMLGLKKGAIVFKGLSDGTVVIEAKPEQEQPDPALESFLAFLAADLTAHPQHLQPLTRTLLDQGRELVGDIAIDLDAPLPDD